MKTLELSQGLVAVVDDLDYEWASQHKWTAVVRDNTAYAYRPTVRAGKKTSLALHRAVLGLEDSSTHVDHRNGDGLDNRRNNLRVATLAQNNRNKGPMRHNSSGYKGVRYLADRAWFIARIYNEGQNHFLGSFDTAEEAARAYDTAARELHGEFAWTNFPLDPNYVGAK